MRIGQPLPPDKPDASRVWVAAVPITVALAKAGDGHGEPRVDFADHGRDRCEGLPSHGRLEREA